MAMKMPPIEGSVQSPVPASLHVPGPCGAGEGAQTHTDPTINSQRWISPVSSSDRVRELRHKPKPGPGQHELPWLLCFQISVASEIFLMCYCFSNQQYFFPESLSIFEAIYIHSTQEIVCLLHTVTSLCGKVLPSPVKAATLALGSPSFCAREYHSCPPSCPHCPRLHMALIYPSLPLPYTATPPNFSSWESCLGNFLALFSSIS